MAKKMFKDKGLDLTVGHYGVYHRYYSVSIGTYMIALILIRRGAGEKLSEGTVSYPDGNGRRIYRYMANIYHLQKSC